MSVNKTFAIVILLEILALANVANAQGVGKSIGERLDDMGRSIFGVFSEDSEDQDAAQSSKPVPKPSTGKYDKSPASSDSAITRNSAIIKPSNAAQPKTVGEASSRQVRVYKSENINTAPTGTASTDNRSGRRFFEDPRIQDNAETPENTPLMPPKSVSRQQATIPSKSASVSNVASEQGGVASKPLHQRLSQFRQSAFDETAKAVPENESTKKVFTPSSQNTPITSNKPSSLGTASSAIEGTAAIKRSQAIASDPLPMQSESSEPMANKPLAVSPMSRPTPAKRQANMEAPTAPVVAERTMPTTRMDSTIASEKQSMPKPNVTQDAGGISANLATPTANNDGVLFARKGPALSVETLGPRKISVGKESTYEVKIINSGDVAAEDLLVYVNLPEWAEMIAAEASIGTSQLGTPAPVSAPLLWRAGHLEAKSQEKLVLRIIPRQSRPFDLAVRWEYKPMATQTMIEVQEPKLEMKLEGPREVHYGQKETYRLKLLNSGTGDAEGVAIKFVPVGAGENVSATYDLGVLPAGEDRQIDVELTARQSGMLEIQVEAKGDTGVHAELAEKVLVRRAALEIVAEGPKLQFVGTTAVYVVRVRNTGNAPAKNTTFSTTLPSGLKYIGGIDGAKIDASGTKLQWTVDSITPEAVQTFTVKCVPNAAGLCRLEVAVTADDDLTASAVAMTQVESVANLAIDVKDPGGPVPLGEEAIYEVRVRNRGTKDAEGIEVIGYFSRGIEPISADGLANRIGPGQVVFTPIPTLAPGAEVVLKIHARAETPGNHVFRTEMHCKALGSRLVSEETTLYYQDALAIPQTLQARPTQGNSIR